MTELRKENSSKTKTMADYQLTVTLLTADHPLVLADNYCLLKTNGTNNIKITIPANANVAFPVGSWGIVVQYNTGTITIEPAPGVTFSASGLQTAKDGDTLTFIKTSVDKWMIKA